MNIQIFGTVCIDKNITEKASYVSAGSPAMFMNKIFKQFGDCHASIIASYGEDYVKYLEGVDIYPPKPNCKETLVYENNSQISTQRTQKSYNRQNAYAIDLDENLTNKLKEADIVFFAPQQPIFTKSYIESISKLKKSDSLMVLIPQGFYRNFDSQDNVIVREFKEASEILPFIDIMIVSEQDHPQMLVQAKQWAKNHNMICIVTLGEKGAVAYKGSSEIILPANPLSEKDIVDSVGSGDIFSASFAYKYKQTEDLKKAGHFANEVAKQCLFYTPDKIKIDLSKVI